MQSIKTIAISVVSAVIGGLLLTVGQQWWLSDQSLSAEVEIHESFYPFSGIGWTSDGSDLLDKALKRLSQVNIVPGEEEDFNNAIEVEILRKKIIENSDRIKLLPTLENTQCFYRFFIRNDKGVAISNVRLQMNNVQYISTLERVSSYDSKIGGLVPLTEFALRSIPPKTMVSLVALSNYSCPTWFPDEWNVGLVYSDSSSAPIVFRAKVEGWLVYFSYYWPWTYLLTLIGAIAFLVLSIAAIFDALKSRPVISADAASKED